MSNVFQDIAAGAGLAYGTLSGVLSGAADGTLGMISGGIGGLGRTAGSLASVYEERSNQMVQPLSSSAPGSTNPQVFVIREGAPAKSDDGLFYLLGAAALALFK